MIIRSEKNKNYSVISNVGINDDRLSLKARGLYAYLLTKPDSWKISDRGLSSVLPEGRSAIAGALKELEDTGYLTRERKPAGDGKFSWSATLVEEPTMARLSMAGKPMAGKPSHIVSTIKVSTEKSSLSETQKAQILELHRGYIKHFKVDPDDYSYASKEEKAALIDQAQKTYRLTDKRVAKAVARLKDCGFDMCRKAIINSAKDDWMKGNNDRGWKMDLYDYLFRSYEQVEKWANK